MKQVALSCLAIDVGHFFHVRKHPHKSAFVPDVNFRHIGVEQSATAQPLDKSVVGSLVVLRCASFEVADIRGTQMKAEQPIQFASNMQLRHPQLDVEVKGIGRELGAKLAFSPTCLFRLENGSAALTLIPMEGVTGDPSLNSVSHEFKIENGLCVLLGPSQGALQVHICFYIDSFALVVPVRGIVNGVQFWNGECVAFKTIGVFPPQLRYVNDLAEGKVSCVRGSLA